jgi:hypothetical protein
MQGLEDYSMTMSPWKTGAERQPSPAAGSGSEGRADAGGSQVQGVIGIESCFQ